MNVSGPLTNPQQAMAFWNNYVFPRIKAALLAGHAMRLSVKPETRSLEQNAHFHALCDVIAKSGHKWMNKTRNAAQWKVLLVSGHAVATNDEVDIVPGLEGEFVNLRESTALMSIKRSSSLIEYTLAFMAHNGIPTQVAEEIPG
jgi:hypothetical protein